MSNITTTVTIDRTAYSAQLGRVESTMLGYEDHGFLTTMVTMDLYGGGIGVGGYALGFRDESWPYSDRPQSYLRLWIDKMLAVSGAEKWEQLPGSRFYVLFEKGGSTLGSRAVGICSLSGEEHFIFSDYTAPVDNS